jgi:hypothetical protein
MQGRRKMSSRSPICRAVIETPLSQAHSESGLRAARLIDPALDIGDEAAGAHDLPHRGLGRVRAATSVPQFVQAAHKGEPAFACYRRMPEGPLRARAGTWS